MSDESKDRDTLARIAERTLGHYEANAPSFWEGTRHHDVSENHAALLGALGGSQTPGDGGLRGLHLLDLGCGPGRDLAAFMALGHKPVGLDGCEAFVHMAREFSSCEVLHQNFFDLSLPAQAFDGVFANASLFHAPRSLLPAVLGEIHRALVPGGVLFCSNPRSFDEDNEGWHGERFGTHLTVEGWTAVIGDAGFKIERQFLRPSGKPPNQQPWSAMVWRKPFVNQG